MIGVNGGSGREFRREATRIHGWSEGGSEGGRGERARAWRNVTLFRLGDGIE